MSTTLYAYRDMTLDAYRDITLSPTLRHCNTPPRALSNSHTRVDKHPIPAPTHGRISSHGPAPPHRMSDQHQGRKPHHPTFDQSSPPCRGMQP